MGKAGLVGGAVSAGIVGSAGAVLWHRLMRRPLPQVKGTIEVQGLHGPVRVRRDRWGVPHITARNTHDLYFAQGFVVASERLFQMELSLRLGTGRLSELIGERTLPMDRFIRTVGLNRAGRRLVDQWDDLSWEMSDAYVAGVRAWTERMPARPIEYEILQVDPMSVEGREAAVMSACASVFGSRRMISPSSVETASGVVRPAGIRAPL